MQIGTARSLDSEPVERIKAIVGRHYRVDDYYEVGREKIREYARAVQDHHPVHRDVAAAHDFGYPDLVAPPAFICLLGGTVQKILTDVLDGYNLTTAIQTDQTIDFARPVVAGDRLTSNLSLQSFRQAFGGDLMVVRNTVTDQHGAQVLVADTGLVARSAPTERDRAIAGALTALVRGDVVSAAGPMSTYTPIGETRWPRPQPRPSRHTLPLAAERSQDLRPGHRDGPTPLTGGHVRRTDVVIPQQLVSSQSEISVPPMGSLAAALLLVRRSFPHRIGDHAQHNRDISVLRSRQCAGQRLRRVVDAVACGIRAGGVDRDATNPYRTIR